MLVGKGMTPRQLERAGKRLHGKKWKAPLARSLGINYVTLWRYLTDASPIPDRVEKHVKLLVAALRR